MKNAQKMVKKFAKARDWDKQMPDHVAKSVSIEAGELLEHFQWSNPTAEEIKKNPEKLAELASELADVFIYCLHMANLLDFDAGEIVKHKLEIAAKKYPAELMRKRTPDEPDAHERYLKIKKEYRQKHG